MDKADEIKSPAISSTVRLALSAAGLLVAGIAAGSLGLPRTTFPSLTSLLGEAVQRVSAVSLVGVVTVAILCAITPKTRKGYTHHIAAQTSLAVLWLAPLALLMQEHSAWTAVIAAVLGIVGVRSMQHALTWVPGQDALIHSLHPDDLPLRFKHSAQISTGAAFAAQIGVLATLRGYMWAGTVLVMASFAIWSWTFAWYAERNDDLELKPAITARKLTAAALAILFTAAGLMPFLRSSGGLGTSSRPRTWHLLPRHGGGPYPAQATGTRPSPGHEGEGNAGIILWAGKKTYTKLVAPVPVRDNWNLAKGSAADPLVIPFDGVYWFFKAPDMRPPINSREAQGSPEAVNIRSTDRRPLSIEAYDHLAHSIDLNCCSKIEIAIRNADRYPDTVSMELVLINTALPEKPSQSLGRLAVKSTRPWKLYEEPVASSETLNFAIPPSRSLRRFDELKIVFRLDRARADAGARIGIDHFVLVPRGL
ncbi:MAG TPA: hypothetical protein VMH04_19915 [Candidatus Solibacter sp.]|nr:hypothetical protein [Candidatus Solibacter sp.]